MTVAELQLLLTDLSKFLRASGAGGVAGELEHISARLLPFKDYKLKAFGDFLVKAEEYSRGVLAPRKTSGGKSKADPQAIAEACQSVILLYERAIDPAVTLEQIETAVRALQELKVSKAKLDEVAQKMGYTQKFKSIPDVLKAIRQKILGRKGTFDRVNA